MYKQQTKRRIKMKSDLRTLHSRDAYLHSRRIDADFDMEASPTTCSMSQTAPPPLLKTICSYALCTFTAPCTILNHSSARQQHKKKSSFQKTRARIERLQSAVTSLGHGLQTDARFSPSRDPVCWRHLMANAFLIHT